MKKRQPIREVILGLLLESESTTSQEVARHARSTRQAAHKQLRALVGSGVLVVEGRGPSTRYTNATTPTRKAKRHVYTREGLSEDMVFRQLETTIPNLAAASRAARETVVFAFSELLNNAIDHSGSEKVEIRLDEHPNLIVFEIIDWGVGAFENVRKTFRLASLLDALQQLTKGKVTTQPDAHTGQGIFFSSKAVNAFELESNGLTWKVDNVRDDQTVAASPPRAGTRARIEVALRPRKTLKEIFDAYTDDFEFSKTKIRVHLFEYGTRFVSRSEAKRLMHGLEKFQHVTLDFKNVEAVGQGFVDEVVRVWSRAHRRTRVETVRMVPAVAFMVQRGLREP